jgi:hypothetical protein
LLAFFRVFDFILFVGDAKEQMSDDFNQVDAAAAGAGVGAGSMIGVPVVLSPACAVVVAPPAAAVVGCDASCAWLA